MLVEGIADKETKTLHTTWTTRGSANQSLKAIDTTRDTHGLEYKS